MGRLGAGLFIEAGARTARPRCLIFQADPAAYSKGLPIRLPMRSRPLLYGRVRSLTPQSSNCLGMIDGQCLCSLLSHPSTLVFVGGGKCAGKQAAVEDIVGATAGAPSGLGKANR